MPQNTGEDLYSDAAPVTAAPEEAEAAPADESAETALLPKTFFAGKDLAPGTECTVRVEQVMEDQVAVSYVPHEGGESAPEAATMPMQDREMAEYMT